MKLIKIAVGGIALLLTLVVVSIALLFAYIDAVARRGVEEGTRFALQVPTSLDSADVDVLGGGFQMHGFTISNPEGYDTRHFLELAEGGVSVDLETLRQDIIELPTLTLTDVDLHLELEEGKANYRVILDNLKRFETGEKQAESDKRFVIRELRIEDVRAHVQVLPVGGDLTEAEVVVPEIVLEDVGSDGSGVSLAEATNIVLKAIFTSILANGEKVLPDELFGDLKNELGELASLGEEGVGLAVDLGEGMTELTGGALQGLGQAAQKLGEGAGEAVEGLGEAIDDIRDQPKDDDGDGG